MPIVGKYFTAYNTFKVRVHYLSKKHLTNDQLFEFNDLYNHHLTIIYILQQTTLNVHIILFIFIEKKIQQKNISFKVIS